MGIVYFLLFGFVFLFCLQVAVAKYWKVPIEPPKAQKRKDLNPSKRVVINDYNKFVNDCNKAASKPPVMKPKPCGYYYTKRRGKRKLSGISHVTR